MSVSGRVGLETAAEENVTCCYAVQNKVWATDPDGNKWEVYVVLDNDATRHHSTHTACCADKPDCCEDKAACCTALAVSEGAVKSNDQPSACRSMLARRQAWRPNWPTP